MIKAYFTQVKAIVDQYAAATFVLETSINFELRPGDQGYLTGTVTFVDDSVLYFREYLDATGDGVDKVMYAYHYQDASNHLIFRYDNARHRPLLSSLEHKHLPHQSVETPVPTIEDVLAEIATFKGWI